MSEIRPGYVELKKISKTDPGPIHLCRTLSPAIGAFTVQKKTARTFRRTPRLRPLVSDVHAGDLGRNDPEFCVGVGSRDPAACGPRPQNFAVDARPALRVKLGRRLTVAKSGASRRNRTSPFGVRTSERTTDPSLSLRKQLRSFGAPVKTR